MPYAFETDGAAIYRQSFATIRSEADLAHFSRDEEPVVVRMIHAAGMIGLEAHIRFTPGMASSARAALQKGAKHFVQKPVKPEVLYEILRYVLGDDPNATGAPVALAGEQRS